MKRSDLKKGRLAGAAGRGLAGELPADSSLADPGYQLLFRQAVEQGLASLDRGEGVPIEEARQRVACWVRSLGLGKRRFSSRLGA
jgi:hypothetical protein